MNYNYSPKKYNFYELIDIFPEAKPYIKNKLKNEIKEYKNDLSTAKKLRTEYQKILSKVYKDRWFWEMVVEELWIKPWTENRLKNIKRNTFYLQALRPKPAGWQEVNSNITDQDIQRAKETPIENFIEFNKMDFAKCPFHEEKTASLKLYRKTNTWWCFSCQSGGDVIELIMRSQKLDFIEAVKISGLL